MMFGGLFRVAGSRILLNDVGIVSHTSSMVLMLFYSQHGHCEGMDPTDLFEEIARRDHKDRYIRRPCGIMCR